MWERTPSGLLATGRSASESLLITVVQRTTSALSSSWAAQVNSNLLTGAWANDTVVVESTPDQIVFRDAQTADANDLRYMRVIVVLE